MSTTLEHATIADLVAENDRLWRASAEAESAVDLIENAARGAIADSPPVSVPVTWSSREAGSAVTWVALWRDGKQLLEGDTEEAALIRSALLEFFADKRPLTDEERDMVKRYNAAQQESIERADAIRERVYKAMGYEVAKAAHARAWADAVASDDRLESAPIRTMADAVAALEYIRGMNQWRTLGDRVIAFLKAA